MTTKPMEVCCPKCHVISYSKMDRRKPADYVWLHFTCSVCGNIWSIMLPKGVEE